MARPVAVICSLGKKTILFSIDPLNDAVYITGTVYGGKCVKTMDQSAVQNIRREMDAAKTGKSARQKMALLALSRPNLTECGRAEWEKEL